MIKPEELTKVTIYGPDTEMANIIKVLHSLEILHIVDHEPEELDIGQPMEGAEKLSDLIITIHAIQSHVQPFTDPQHIKERTPKKKTITTTL